MIDPGRLTHSVTIETPGTPVADGDGGYTQNWTSMTPNPIWCAFYSPSPRDMQRLAGGNATMAAASHIVEMHYYAGVTDKMRVNLDGRPLNILGVQNVDEAGLMTRLFCEEVLNVPLDPIQSSWVEEGWIE